MKLKNTSVVVLLITAAVGVLRAQVAPPPLASDNGPAPVIRQGPQILFGGSIPSGPATAEQLDLSLREAIQRGLRYSLATLTSADLNESTVAERRRMLSAMLPKLYAGVTQVSSQIDLVAFGLSVPGFPPIVGPFGYQNARAYLSQTVYDRSSQQNLKSADETLKAAKLTGDEARNLVVQAVSNAYVAVLAANARVDAITAEVNTADALFTRATDNKAAGTIPAIEVLRAEVQLKREQQRLLAEKNNVEKAKLVLARAVGFAPGQKFRVTGTFTFESLSVDMDGLLKEAYAKRADYLGAQANVKAAEFAVESAKAESRPTVAVDADYGLLGNTLAESHGTFSITAGVRIPIYSGGKNQSDIAQAEALLHNRQHAVDELRARIEFEIRTALLDLQSAADQVTVAKRNVELAAQTLDQAKDRFAAGVASNIEVVEAQQAVAQANEDHIASMNAHTSAKIALAAALGAAETEVPRFLNLP